MYSLHEVAELLGLTYGTIYKLVKANKIKSVKIGRKVLRIHYTELHRLEREGTING